MKVYVDVWVQFCANGDTELGRHCVKREYVCKGFLILKKSEANILRLRCSYSLGVLHFFMPLVPLLNHRFGCFEQDFFWCN